jgi:hypothetical protein
MNMEILQYIKIKSIYNYILHHLYMCAHVETFQF